ncbi:salicylate hydroxylase [Rhizobium sp. BK313]|uniref:FAD-dependent oxidoreductase n=1 Tax=Rhizobium sp. BK313 TaxID=2587081 RepID=UPI00105C7784|nr:NAD(P)/FAD-dependent oxidoreductase [Rhizobium sp. BK313]MBB3458149.1 salicylate hydroxylase [Rhizobium sp. BK313]
MASRQQRIVVAGAGIAGSLIASGLSGREDVEVICLERVGATDHMDAGTGLNIGPNAIKALKAVMPERADAIVSNSLAWQSWSIALTSGRSLMNLALSDVADNAGIRIRWAELYALLRKPLTNVIRYGAALSSCGRDGNGLFVTYHDKEAAADIRIDNIDLIIAGDGRYSRIREHFVSKEEPRFLGVCLYRLLFPAGADCPIDDYGQWFNGPNRLLAFRVPGDFVYCAGSFPIGDDGVVSDEMKTPEFLRGAYTPEGGMLCAEAAYLISALEQYTDRIHWARLQDGTTRYDAGAGVVLVGDSAHPMVPTLGQGATQAVEDACVVVDEVRRALMNGASLEDIPASVSARRTERAEFVVSFSRDATDTMLAGSDPVAGTLKKLEPAFTSRLERLYRDVPVPLS